MVLLWKDPQGRRSVSTIKKPGSLPPNSNSSAKEARKIANLEKSIVEKDNIIVQLKEVIRTLKLICFTGFYTESQLVLKYDR